MSEAVVEFLITELSRVIREEINIQSGVKQEIESVKKELESISAFLHVAEAKEEDDEEFRTWVKQVRDVAYDIEDVLDGFLFRLADHQVRVCDRRYCKFLKKIGSAVNKWKANHQISFELQSIKTKVNVVSQRHQRYSLPKQDSSSTMASNENIDQFRRDALLVEESEIVGRDNPKSTLIHWLLEGESRLQVHAIAGMGGLGKTTLVKQVYNNKEVKDSFKKRALVTVSQSMKVEELLRELIRQLLGVQNIPQEVGKMDSHHLKEKLKGLLPDERYLIVLDDVWEIQQWDLLKVAMPVNKCGSRVIITTRDHNLARFSSSEFEGKIFDLMPLSESDSWILFRKTAFPATQSCPQHLESICGQILAKCGGLPLAILAIGGLLRTKDRANIDEWQKVQYSLDYELQRSHLPMAKRILSLSIHNLPYHIKSCFLLLSIFPEDYLINCNRLMRLWISEGFVEEIYRRTLEEVAEYYLYELINRSLLQVVKVDDGNIKRCRIHDFLREIILSMSREQRFVDVVDLEKEDRPLERARRLSVHNHAGKTNQLTQCNSTSPLRSLFLFDETEFDLPKMLDGERFKLLKVLDLRQAALDVFPQEISKLFLLRYLSLRRTEIFELPKSIGNLQCLETLDLLKTFVSELPSEMSKLHRLRHLRGCRWGGPVVRKLKVKWKEDGLPSIWNYGGGGFSAKFDIGGWVSIQELYYLEASPENNLVIQHCGRLTQLRKLCLMNLRAKHEIALCSSISNLTNLRTLRLHAIEKIDLQEILRPPPFLGRLYLQGPLGELPIWVYTLQNLKVLHLVSTSLKNGLVDHLYDRKSFTNLSHLVLCNAFDFERITVTADFFPRLKTCCVISESEQSEVVVAILQPAAMPELEHVYVQAYHKSYYESFSPERRPPKGIFVGDGMHMQE